MVSVFVATRWNSYVSYVLSIAESEEVALRAVELDKQFRKYNGETVSNYNYLIEERRIYTAQDASDMESYFEERKAQGAKYA